MTKPIVADASPLISFARADGLELLRQVVRQLLIPDAVYEEIVVKGAGKPGAAEVSGCGWITEFPLTDMGMLGSFPANLGDGVREAILLSEELGAYLLVDDPAARREARVRGIELISTLDVLDEAKDLALIARVKTTLDELVRNGYRLKRTLYRAKLRDARECP